MSKSYFVYMITNKTNAVLYTGITSNLERRTYEHKEGKVKGFTQRYNCKKLVYFEQFSAPENAILREKEIKGWLRAKKDELVNAVNPNWVDISENNYQFPRYPSLRLG